MHSYSYKIFNLIKLNFFFEIICYFSIYFIYNYFQMCYIFFIYCTTASFGWIYKARDYYYTNFSTRNIASTYSQFWTNYWPLVLCP